MNWKIIFSVLLIFILCQNGNALRCYTCSSKHPNETCFTPIDVNAVPSFECNRNIANFSQYGNLKFVNPELYQTIDSSTDYECVIYEKHYINDNSTEMTRGCFPKTAQTNACQVLNITASIEPFHLTKCSVCDKDNCNSSSSLRISISLTIFALVLRQLFR